MSNGNTSGISVIVPAYNRLAELGQCLAAIQACSGSDVEIIVVDDASTDDVSPVAQRFGARLLRLPRNSGPGAARNLGVRHARGDVLFFVDADVVLAPGAVSHVGRIFADHPDLAAVFGSYDACPQADGLVSQYRNLLHHFVHQHANSTASTFWAGCGAVRRSAFERVGGFDGERYPRPSIEDIELGYRLRRQGYRILLDKTLQGTHLKQWKLSSVIKTDIARRAIPWSRLILESGHAPEDLNLDRAQRLSVALAALACIVVPFAARRLELLVLPVAAILGMVALNRELFAFFVRQRGFAFAGACVPLHLLYYIDSGLGYLFAWVGWHLRGLVARPRRAVGRR